tara:strand:- start:500 stop:790 length:291 start_codon:yes stop_codon:yes gene_type:complete
MKSKVNFIPTNGAVLVELPEIKEETKGGLIKSADMMEKERQSHDGFLEIVSVSDEETKLKIGTKVMANLMQCSMIDVEGTKYGLLPSHAVLGYKPK